MDLLKQMKEICRIYEISPKRSKGQNFLGRLITLIVNEEELSEKLKETIGYEELIEKINV
jgi:hypothetical protein